MSRLTLLFALTCLVTPGLGACKPAGGGAGRTSAPDSTAVAVADDLCMSQADIERIEARKRPSETEVLKVLRHYDVCAGDLQTSRALARRWAQNGSPAAAYDLAVVNLNTSTDLDQVVPLLKRGAAAGYQPSIQQLHDMVAYTAVANVFGMKGILPKVEVEVPDRFRNVTAAAVHRICRSEDPLDAVFCQLAVSQVMVETGSCRGAPYRLSVRESRRRIAEYGPSDEQTAFDYVHSAVKACDTTEQALPPADAPARPAPR